MKVVINGVSPTIVELFELLFHERFEESSSDAELLIESDKVPSKYHDSIWKFSIICTTDPNDEFPHDVIINSGHLSRKRKTIPIAPFIWYTFANHVNLDAIKQSDNVPSNQIGRFTDVSDHLSDYKFVIVDDRWGDYRDSLHITEAIVKVFEAGVIPIYIGTRVVADYFNPERFIYYKVGNLGSVRKQIERLSKPDEFKKVVSKKVMKEPRSNWYYPYKLEDVINYISRYLYKLCNLEYVSKYDMRTGELINDLGDCGIYRRGNKFIYLADEFRKINGVDCILWVNLDKSVRRRKRMSKMFSNVVVPNQRVKGINGRKDVVDTFEWKRRTSDGEFGCTLSHVKAISLACDAEYEYVIITEDDIEFSVLQYYDFDIESVICMMPDDAGVMTLHKHAIMDTSMVEPFRYDLYDSSTCMYLVRTSRMKDFVSKFRYMNGIFTVSVPMSAADRTLYDHSKSYEFKYVMCLCLDEDSVIHPDHLPSHKRGTNSCLEAITRDANKSPWGTIHL